MSGFDIYGSDEVVIELGVDLIKKDLHLPSRGNASNNLSPKVAVVQVNDRLDKLPAVLTNNGHRFVTAPGLGYTTKIRIRIVAEG